MLDTVTDPAVAPEPLSRLEDYEEFCSGLENFKNNSWGSDRWVTFRLRFGIYAQKQEGVHMVRSKIPGGRLSIDWIRASAKANRDYCGGTVHITTRQGFQYYFVKQDSLPGLLKDLYSAGMTTREASGNTFRNPTACPLSGFCPRERVDAGAVAQRLAVTWLRHPLVQHMPRKFKIAVSGCELDCGATSIDDLGLIATTKDGQPGFRVVAGGGLGSVPRSAIELLDFITEKDLPALQEAMAHLHHRHSNRKRKMTARIKFLVKKFGEEEFIKMFLDEFEHARRLPQRPWEPLQWRDPADDQPPPPRRGRITQHDGKVALVIRPPFGSLTSDQLDALADAADNVGASEFRITRNQNIIAIGIPPDKADVFTQQVRDLDLDVGDEPHGLGDVVVCPGTSTCPIGINNSNALVREMLDDAESFSGMPETRLRISGCHNSCGQHHVGDFGLHGVAKKIGGKNAPHYQFHIGGEADVPGAIGMSGPEVPARHAKDALKALLAAYGESRNEGESVRIWSKRTGEEGIKKILASFTEGGYDADDLSLRLDVGTNLPFFPPATAVGECAAPAVVGEYLADLSLVGRFDLIRSLAIGDNEEAMEAGRRSLVSTARRILFVIGIDTDNLEDAALFQEVCEQCENNESLLASLKEAITTQKEAAKGSDLDDFAKALAVFAEEGDRAIEKYLLPSAVIGATI